MFDLCCNVKMVFFVGFILKLIVSGCLFLNLIVFCLGIFSVFR